MDKLKEEIPPTDAREADAGRKQRMKEKCLSEKSSSEESPLARAKTVIKEVLEEYIPN